MTPEEHRALAFSTPLDELDIAQPTLFQQDVIWPYFERLRKEAPVHYCKDSTFGPYWSCTSYDAIMAVDTDHNNFSSSFDQGGIVIADQPADFLLPMFIAMDPPKHDEQRKTVQPAVNPAALRNYEPLIRERTQLILDRLPVGEPFDWVDTVSIELTTMMLATLFDFPFEERRKLTRWSDVATGRNNPEICESEEQWRQELLECLGYFQGLWNQAANEEPKPNLISMLAHGSATQNMPPQEFLGNIILLIVGGNDTTRNSMSASVYCMNKWPEQYEKLRNDHSLVPSFVSEIIRWQTPLAHMRRTALRDVELMGKQIKKGDRVVMWYASGNRDEAVFENPNEVIIDRPNVRRHLSFGFGIHRCVGNRLAEQQLQILWEELLKRYPNVRLLEEPSRTPSLFVKGYTRMMVEIPK